jgi:hypothetical protein
VAYAAALRHAPNYLPEGTFPSFLRWPVRLLRWLPEALFFEPEWDLPGELVLLFAISAPPVSKDKVRREERMIFMPISAPREPKIASELQGL